jgi:hypothetical protein
LEPFQINGANLYISSWERVSDAVRAGISTRLGGRSGPPFSSLNCGAHVGDDVSSVIFNRKLVCDEAGFSFDEWTCAQQVHGIRLYRVEKSDRGKDRFGEADAIFGFDGLYTNEPGIFLAAFFADCVPLYFFDPVKRVVGIAHAGWRGTVAAIAKEMVFALVAEYGCDPREIWAAIGPSIGKCCYEVDENVYLALSRLLGDEAARVAAPMASRKYLVDLKEANRIVLIEAGILPQNIEVSTLCTSCRTDWFFSHRKENGKTGRMAAFIALKR